MGPFLPAEVGQPAFKRALFPDALLAGDLGRAIERGSLSTEDADDLARWIVAINRQHHRAQRRALRLRRPARANRVRRVARARARRSRLTAARRAAASDGSDPDPATPPDPVDGGAL